MPIRIFSLYDFRKEIFLTNNTRLFSNNYIGLYRFKYITELIIV